MLDYFLSYFEALFLAICHYVGNVIMVVSSYELKFKIPIGLLHVRGK